MSILTYLQQITFISLLMLTIMFIVRSFILLVFANKRELKTYKIDLLKAFFLGMRFDLKIIAIINVIPLLFAFIVFAFQVNSFFLINHYFLITYYFISLSLLSILLGIDIGFFSYFNSHINYLIFGFFDDDTTALIKTMRDNYNIPLYTGLILLYAVCLFLLIKFILSTKIIYSGLPVIISLSILFLFFIINFLFARGSLKSFPLGINHAQVSRNEFINKLAINGIITFFKALRQRKQNNSGNYNLAKQYGFTDNIDQACKIINPNLSSNNLMDNLTKKISKNTACESIKPHVIVVMMESFASHLLNFETTELDLLGSLRQHFAEDIVFKNFTADGGGTIESLLALITNMPHRANSPNYTESELLNVTIKSSIANVYKQQGYETSIIYGGSLSWRNIGIFLNHQNFDHVEGEQHIKNIIPLKSKNYDHTWGIHDQYLYDYIVEKLNNASKPQFIVAMTTSNHPPFEYPETYQLKPNKITNALQKRLLCKPDIMQQRLNVYQYSNDKAGKFIDQVKSSSLKENTIIALTGDHGFWGMYTYNDDELFTKYTVPFYLYIPQALRPSIIDTKKFASHKDIMPTLFHLSLSDTNYIGIGKDLFNTNQQSYAFNSNELIANQQGTVIKNPNPQFFTWTNDNLVKIADKNSSLENLLNYYHAALSITDIFIRNHS